MMFAASESERISSTLEQKNIPKLSDLTMKITGTYAVLINILRLTYIQI